MSFEFEPEGVDFKGVEQDYADETFLSILEEQKRKLEADKTSTVDFSCGKTRIDSYRQLRNRILAFGGIVFPDVYRENKRASHFGIGMIYAHKSLGLGWARTRRLAGSKYRALTFQVGEAVNLEGEIATATDPEYHVRAITDERFTDPMGAYWKAIPRHGADDDDKAHFMLGSGLVLTIAQDVETLKFTGDEHAQAMAKIRDQANMLRGQSGS